MHDRKIVLGKVQSDAAKGCTARLKMQVPWVCMHAAFDLARIDCDNYFSISVRLVSGQVYATCVPGYSWPEASRMRTNVDEVG